MSPSGEPGSGAASGSAAPEPAPLRPTLTPAVEWVAYAGMLPFLLALVAVAMAPGLEQRELGQRLALGYGAAILSFIGAVHWGLALGGRWSWSVSVILGAILPAVAATLALLAGGRRGLGLLIVAFGLFWLYEHHWRAAQLPADYLALRRNLTLLVCTSLVLILFAAERAGLG